jgi:DNA polymerase-3 subunit delta'
MGENMGYFANIIGQDQAINLLQKSMDNGNISHAYLFSGPSGVGKMQVAMAFAQTLISREDKQAGVYFDEQLHPDLLIIEKLENRSLISKEQISQEMEPWLGLKPYRAKHRVAIVRDAHLLSLEAANALLKTLEEPPAYALIMLISDDDNILETIISRCQVLRFFALPEKDIEDYLLKQGYDREKASQAAKLGQGSMASALHLVGEEGLEQVWEVAVTIIKDLARGKREAIFEAATKMQSAPDLIIKIVETILRDALVMGASRSQELLLGPEEPELQKLLMGKDPGQLMNAIVEIDKLKSYYRRNVNTLLINTNIGYQLWEALH